MIRYELGMELALPEPNVVELPNLWTRESLLAAVLDQVHMDLAAPYELRLILKHDVIVDCPHDVTEGEMVFTVGKGMGGPVDDKRFGAPEDVIAEADRLGRSGTLPDALASVITGKLEGDAANAKRFLVFPRCSVERDCYQQMAKLEEPVTMHGTCYVPARDVARRAQALGTDVAHLLRLLDFCERSRVVLSARID